MITRERLTVFTINKSISILPGYVVICASLVISYSENLSFLLDGFSSPPQLRIKQKEFTEE